MLAVLAIAFALTGAPATTAVTCDLPTFSPAGSPVILEAGLAYIPEQRIRLVPWVCKGNLFTAMTPKQRAKSDGPFDSPYIAGQSALVLLHELTHIATGSHDETLVECKALELLPSFLARYYRVGHGYLQALNGGRKMDSGLPANYHERSCQ